ncbi:hypothetical protein [Peptoniphilus senegalensis]|uniref:hypothetical protein n=1 Tax=Peptoniphilus senegalensis TaxID=1465757 RepID=UPI0002E09207|nr:hypothetical protein [Peptoniphilus senegalensis]
MKKKIYIIFYFIAIIITLFITLKFNKNYLLKDLDIEGNNKVILEKENFNNYSLKLKEDINYNKLYIYKLKNDEFYVFVYSKYIFVDRYNLDDKFITKENSINTLSSNFKYNNLLNIDLEKEPIKVDVKSEKNENLRNTLIKYFVIVIFIGFLGYRKDKRKN